MTTAQLRALDKQHLWHPFTPMSLWLEGDPLVITAGEGFYLIDSDGNRYLDGVSSLWFNIGHPETNEFIAFTEAYHGDTVGAMSIGRMPAFHKPYLPLLFKVHFAPSPSPGTPGEGRGEGRASVNAAREILENRHRQIA